MNFFRMRILNTFLVLLIGVLLGYIARGRHSLYAEKMRNPVSPAAASSPYEGGDPASGFRSEDQGGKTAAAQDITSGEEFELPVALPAAQTETSLSYPKENGLSQAQKEGRDDPDAVQNEKTGSVLRGIEDEFFRNPGRFSGEEIELELQMLTAAKKQKGWRINLAHIRSGKSADYLYVDDESVLGDNPDLRIGFFYKTRFRCRKGDPAVGNTLLSLIPTGDKAAWATGISAIE